MARSSAFKLFFVIMTFNLSTAFYSNFLYRCDNNFPDNLVGKGSDVVDYTHDSITRRALLNVTEELGKDVAESAPYTDTRFEWLVNRKQALEAILESSRELDRLGHSTAANHFNGEQINEGNAKLISWQKQIVELSRKAELSPHNYDLIRYLVGQSLHLIQDFYSNTGWIEINGKEESTKESEMYYTALGKEGEKLLEVQPPHRATCISTNCDEKKACTGNLVHSPTKITSGYRPGQDIEIPPFIISPIGIKSGKCNHGGKLDGSSSTSFEGGINSESNNYFLSPKRHHHNRSSQAAILASQKLLYPGLSTSHSNLSSKELLAIMGVDLPAHISFLQTSALRLALYGADLERGQWDSYHLYNNGGDTVTEGPDVYRNMKDTQDLTISQDTILKASGHLPENSHLVLLTTAEVEWRMSKREELLTQQVLVERNIRLIVFVLVDNKSADIRGRDRINRLCKVTKGQMFYVTQVSQMMWILQQMDPYHHTTNYKIHSNSVNVFVPARQTMTVIMNCHASQSAKMSLSAEDIQGVSVRYLNSSNHTIMYSVTSQAGISQIVQVPVDQTAAEHCTLSAWSTQAIITAYPANKGYRHQIYPTKIRVPGSVMVVEINPYVSRSISPFKVVLDGETVPFNKCMLDLTFLTDGPIPSHNGKEDVIDLQLDFNGSSIVLEDYLIKSPVEINGVKVVPANTSSLNITIAKTSRLSSIDFSIAEREDNYMIDIISHQYGKGTNQEKFIITLKSEDFPRILRPITFVMRGRNIQTGEEAIATHTFHTVPSAAAIDTEHQTTTDIVSDATPDITVPKANLSTTSHWSIHSKTFPTRKHYSTTDGKLTADQVKIFLLSVLFTVIGLLVVIVMLAMAMLLYRYYCKNKQETDSNSVLSYRSLPLIMEKREPVTHL